MSDKFTHLDLDTLKATLEQKRLLLEANEPGTNTKDLYRDLKTLQYEISMRSAQTEAPELESTPRLTA